MKKRDKQKTSLVEKYILTKIPLAKKEDSIKSVLSTLEKISNKYDSVDYVYIINDKKELIGVVSVKNLFNHLPKTKMKKIMVSNVVSASPEMEMERIADIALKHDIKAVPITKEKKLIGTIPSRKILSVINKALKEDILHFAGVHKSHLDFDNSLEIPVAKALKNRLPWLIVGLAGAILMALFINFFESTLTKYIIIAAFIPAIVYINGALSAQTLTILVRDMAFMGKSMNLKKYIIKQINSAFLMSLVIIIIMFSVISLLWKQPYIALVISSAAFISLLITNLISIFIAISIKRFKFDPALGSGPIATVISDMTSIVIYFVIVFLML